MARTLQALLALGVLVLAACAASTKLLMLYWRNVTELIRHIKMTLPGTVLVGQAASASNRGGLSFLKGCIDLLLYAVLSFDSLKFFRLHIFD
ncbi:hypothetical protein AMTR_s00343p00007270 [Amborella trichopoda]|uniref:Uncharacterized protein n=1 Tax=Amborella trichopoda TaxID=13333 RepID=W1P5N6_AMBTC|nr:hypothetical protein AMTR_s00343p00007270 [Amborella trichopoda]